MCSINMAKERPFEIVIRDLSELDQAVQSLLNYLGERRKIAFAGEIGAGKTTFIQAFCRHLGVEAPATSPTFSLVNEYSFKDASGHRRYIYHMDLYRLKRVEEALDLGIEEYLDSEDYCLIEWPELLKELLPEDTVWINIHIMSDSTRKVLVL